MRKHLCQNQRDSILRVLYNRYQADPETLRHYLPEIAEELDRLSPSKAEATHRSILTELERRRLTDVLVQLAREKDLTPEKAIAALEYCATLVQDESLPDEIERQTLMRFLRQAVGINLSRVSKATKSEVRDGEVTKEIAVLRGVHLHLTWNDRLLAISILPPEMKKRSAALKFVALAKDNNPDVAAHHDTYFAEEISAHGSQDN